MAWLMHRTQQRAAIVPETAAPVLPSYPDIDALLAGLRPLMVRVPCCGCGGAHEMTCAELVARQLIRGSGWDSEECDDTVTLAAVLSPAEVLARAGDVAAIRALLEQRGSLLPASAAPSVCTHRERHHVLMAH